jgi:hypothetical protein
MHKHPKWKHIGFVKNYALCIVDELNYAIYKTDQPSGYKHSVRYYGDLSNALCGLLERLVRDKVSQEGIDEIMNLIETIKAAKDEVLAFGRKLKAIH